MKAFLITGARVFIGIAFILSLLGGGIGLPLKEAMAQPELPKLVINEIDYDQPSTDTAEFIEIKNVGTIGINLGDFVMQLVNGSDGTVYNTISLPDTTLAANDYYVVCANAATTANCDLDVTTDTNLIQNGDPDAVGLRYMAGDINVLIDVVSYEGNTTGYTEGSGSGLIDDYNVVGGSISRCPDGADTNVNNVDFKFVSTITPGAENSCSVVDDPPTVTSNTPVDGATNVAVNSDITITFSEPVGVTDPWFSISCTQSGAHTASVTDNSQTIFTLNPDTDFNNSESCKVTVTGSAVADQDGTPDNMAADHSFSFTTVGSVTVPVDIVINEFSASTTGTDVEYIEIYGTPSSDLSAYSLLHIEGDFGTSAGTIDSVINLLGSTNASGFYLASLSANTLENNTISLLLVKDFTGTKGTDLDTNNDGAFDATPWSEIVDSIAVNDGGAGDITYGTPSLGVSYDGLPYAPGGASRIPDGYDTDAATDWVRNDFDLFGIPGKTGSPIEGEAINTPGAPNEIYVRPPIINEIDSDDDGADNLEFVELFDGGVGNKPLDGLVVVFFNGSNDKSYRAIDLDGYTTDPSGYFLIGNSGVTPAPSITFPGNTLQNGADAVALYWADSTDFPNDTAVTTTNLIDAIVYDTNDANDSGLLALLNTDEPQVDESSKGDSEKHSNQRCPNGSGGDRNTSTYAQWAPTPGSINVCADPLACGTTFTPIYAVQGEGDASPLVGNSVEVEGIVVGDFQYNSFPDDGDLDGFHLQDSSGDGNSATSDGVFIYAPGALNVSVGDRVRVLGTISEFNDMTEITASQVQLCSTGQPITPTELTLPLWHSDSLEPFEGMLVTFPQALVISEYFNFDRYGEIVLTSERHLTPTAEFEPGSPEYYDAVDEISLDRITLDDGRTTQNPDPAIHPNGLEFTLDNLFRGGDLVSNVTGVIDYSFGLYRIQPTEGADYSAVNPRPLIPPAVGGSVKVVSMNVLNYFTTLGERGADTQLEFDRQRAKIIAAIVQMNPDIAGLVEIENNDTALANLVDGLNAAAGAGTYAYISNGVFGTDEIKVALIYKPATVSPMGAYAKLDSSVDPHFNDDYNRPVLAQTFIATSGGGIFTVAVNHLKSKGSDCDDIGDPDLDDGAGNCNLTRLAAVQAEVDWLAGDPTGSKDPDFLIIGDLNSYDKEDPIDALLAGADDIKGTSDDFVDMLFDYQGEYAYSYVYDGQIGYLDYAASNSLASQITGVNTWHINADEPDLIDYDMSFKADAQDELYEEDAFRSSDHDPVLIGMNLIKSAPVQAEVEETPAEMPATGFAPGVVTALPLQAVQYSALGDLWLEIPALGVKSAITGVPITDGAWDVTWLGSQAGWLEVSAFPGASGNSVLTGHVWDALNRPGVFEKLGSLRFGDQVIVHNGGKAYVYEVRENMQVGSGDVDQLLKHKDRPWLTLVTCRGFDEKSGEYLARVLVRAVLVKVR